MNMEFPTETEFNGGTQEFLLKLRDSELKNEELLEEFYQNGLGCGLTRPMASR